jgi:primary-amine oxidase
MIGALSWLAVGCAHPAVQPPRGVEPQRLPAVAHPLDPLDEGELRTAFDVVLAHFQADPSLPKQPLRFPLVALAEPAKADVLAWQPGQRGARHAEVQVLHYPSNRSWRLELDLTTRRVLAIEALPAGTQPALSSDEFEAAAKAVRAYVPWQQALRARGVDPAHAYIDGWAAGDTPLPDDVAATLPHGHDTRLMRCLTFDRGAALATFDPQRPHNPYDRPVEGIVVTVDLNARQVVHMTDTLVRGVLADSGNATPTRALRPLVTAQPAGTDIELAGHRVRWNGWQFYVALQPREGLVLYDVRFEDAGVWRQIAYRLALSEIYVPYGLGEANWAWRGAFDVGEYNAGSLAQKLEKNRDVPDNAVLLDAVVASDAGPTPARPSGTRELGGAIALYERDAGSSWTRTDPENGARDTRFARELVATWNCWLGNYIYGFEWVFKLDGSIEVRTQLSGTTLNRGTDAQPEPSAPKIAKDARGVLLAAPNHQHFLNFRLDLDIDGPANGVMEMEAAHLPGTGFGNAFAATMQHLHEEGPRDVNPWGARHWHVESSRSKNAFGSPTSYALEPGAFAVPYAAHDFAGLARARFAQHQLWLTRYRADERYAAGMFPNQGKHEDGVSVYSQDAEPLADEDVVLWFTTGFTHLAKPEDHPVMPTESIGFRLAPRGFFARNPALGVADQQ